MWTIDLCIASSSQWLRTAARYDSVDDATTMLERFPGRDCYGRPVFYRARQVDELDLQYDADRARLRRTA